MSRYTIQLEENKEFVYGFDHAMGYFYQLWDYNKGEESEECLIEDKCQMITRLTKGDIINLMKKYKANPTHIKMLVLDLPF